MADRKVYMDYNATTPLHPEVQKSLIDNFAYFGNPSSMHEPGRAARHLIEESRVEIARFIGASPEEIVFVGSGSEANNTVLNLAKCGGPLCRGLSPNNREIVTTSIEHPCVLDTSRCFQRQGSTAHFIKVDRYGKVDIQELEDSINDSTAIVSVMFANNEIGTIQNLKEIAAMVRNKKALFHTDAVQALGKVPFNVKDLDVDYLSLSAHKIYGPKGIGALYIRKGAPFCPFIHGGHQETGRRAGTENSFGIYGFGKAVEVLSREMDENNQRIRGLRDKLKAGIIESIPDIHLNGHPEDVVPNTLNVSFMGAEGEAILLYMDLAGIFVSTGSACASGSLDPSHVLLATGLDAEYAHGSIRFSLGRENTEEDVDYVLQQLPPIIERIRKMSTVYQGGKK
ncbi:MAG: aminotransferase class V-fold PLP-dependent enzyme [Spirochaetales bacterium]|nr:aminotransferase class V-fold PLP-dependent enzyme [Spirochaetales bacterium]